MASQSITVPDIGDFEDVPIIEILVSVGDTVSAEDPLVTLESDKATMDVPAPSGGTVESIDVSIGDRVSQGSTLLTLSGEDSPAEEAPQEASAATEEAPQQASAATEEAPQQASAATE